MQLFIWFLFWAGVWGLYNAYFKWKLYKSGKKEHFLTAAFFLIGSILFNWYFRAYTSNFVSVLILATMVSILIGFFFASYYPFYKRIKRGKYYLVSLSTNILWQQSMIIVALAIVSRFFGNKYLDVYFGLFFILTHLPVLTFKWAKLRILLVTLPFFGGMLFSYLIRNYGGLGVFTAFQLHFLTYIPIFYSLRDERVM